VYTGSNEYLLESLLGPNSNFDLSRTVIDMSLSEKVADLCKRMGLDYIGCGEDEEKTMKLKRKLKFPNRFATGI